MALVPLLFLLGLEVPLRDCPPQRHSLLRGLGGETWGHCGHHARHSGRFPINEWVVDRVRPAPKVGDGAVSRVCAGGRGRAGLEEEGLWERAFQSGTSPRKGRHSATSSSALVALPSAEGESGKLDVTEKGR